MRIALLYVVIIFGSLLSKGQNIVKRVCDKETQMPLSFIHIAILDSKDGTFTNAEGFFSISLIKDKQYRFTCVGYKPLIVKGIELQKEESVEMEQ